MAKSGYGMVSDYGMRMILLTFLTKLTEFSMNLFCFPFIRELSGKSCLILSVSFAWSVVLSEMSVMKISRITLLTHASAVVVIIG